MQFSSKRTAPFVETIQVIGKNFARCSRRKFLRKVRVSRSFSAGVLQRDDVRWQNWRVIARYILSPREPHNEALLLTIARGRSRRDATVSHAARSPPFRGARYLYRPSERISSSPFEATCERGVRGPPKKPELRSAAAILTAVASTLTLRRWKRAFSMAEDCAEWCEISQKNLSFVSSYNRLGGLFYSMYL